MPAQEHNRSRLHLCRPARSVALENQFLSHVQPVIRKLENVFRDFLKRIIEEPFDQRVQLPVLFQDVKNVVIPAVFTDQPEQRGRRGRVFFDRYPLIGILSNAELVAFGDNSLSIGDNVVNDEIFTLSAKFGAKPAALRESPEPARSFFQFNRSFFRPVPSR
jgi:hypothetical protein